MRRENIMAGEPARFVRKAISQNKPRRATFLSQMIKVLILIFALITAYLFALNGIFRRLRVTDK